MVPRDVGLQPLP
jgi:hypothetical protein